MLLPAPMCGRFVSKDNLQALAKEYRATRITPRFFAPSHNVAPAESVPIVIEDPDATVRLELARFGMPMTAGGKTFPLLNLQSEKAANREDLKTRRCVIPAAGFFELFRHAKAWTK